MAIFRTPQVSYDNDGFVTPPTEFDEILWKHCTYHAADDLRLCEIVCVYRQRVASKLFVYIDNV